MNIREKMTLAIQGAYVMTAEDMMAAMKAGLITSISIPNGPDQADLMLQYALLLAKEEVLAKISNKEDSVEYEFLKKVTA